MSHFEPTPVKIQHPAHCMPFDDLVDGLDAAKAAGHVTEKTDYLGLSLFTYRESCVYERAWTPFTTVARGLIVDRASKRIVATPWAKFFNIGEMEQTVPDLPFDAYEKADGSLIIIFYDGRSWRTATKGSFDSSQAQWAAQYIQPVVGKLEIGVTYLAEYTGPENRIVVHYQKSELVLLSAFHDDGYEMSRKHLEVVAYDLGWRIATKFTFTSISDLIAHAAQLSSNEEGYVLRFENGLRLKIKGEEYRRIHALISGVTPLGIWAAMEAGDDMEDIRRHLPEEYWIDFDAIFKVLTAKLSNIINQAAIEMAQVAHMSDKEVGLMLAARPQSAEPSWIFPMRKHGSLMEGRTRQSVFRSIRPFGNMLEGYTPSTVMDRVITELS